MRFTDILQKYVIKRSCVTRQKVTQSTVFGWYVSTIFGLWIEAMKILGYQQVIVIIQEEDGNVYSQWNNRSSSSYFVCDNHTSHKSDSLQA